MSCVACVQVCDDTAPTLIGVPANIDCVEATSAAGAVVTFVAPTATDSVDGAAVVPVCTPASGSTFALGLTTVTCTATDVHGNVASASFTVKVSTALLHLLPLCAHHCFARDTHPFCSVLCVISGV
jgi:hypothetical protein